MRSDNAVFVALIGAAGTVLAAVVAPPIVIVLREKCARDGERWWCVGKTEVASPVAVSEPPPPLPPPPPYRWVRRPAGRDESLRSVAMRFSLGYYGTAQVAYVDYVAGQIESTNGWPHGMGEDVWKPGGNDCYQIPVVLGSEDETESFHETAHACSVAWGTGHSPTATVMLR